MGKHQPYRDTPPQHRKPLPQATPQEKAALARHTAIDYLNKHVGGTWRWDEAAHQFNADFVPEIAVAIRTFLQPAHVEVGLQPLERTKQARLTIAPDQLGAVQCAPFLAGAKPLAEQYRQLMATTKRDELRSR